MELPPQWRSTVSRQCGYLHRRVQGGGIKLGGLWKWRKRWFVLNGSLLRYFTRTDKPHGMLILDGESVVTIGAISTAEGATETLGSSSRVHAAPSRVPNGRDLVFHISGTARNIDANDSGGSEKDGRSSHSTAAAATSGERIQWELCAESEAELHDWCVALRRAVLEVRNWERRASLPVHVPSNSPSPRGGTREFTGRIELDAVRRCRRSAELRWGSNDDPRYPPRPPPAVPTVAELSLLLLQGAAAASSSTSPAVSSTDLNGPLSTSVQLRAVLRDRDRERSLKREVALAVRQNYEVQTVIRGVQRRIWLLERHRDAARSRRGFGAPRLRMRARREAQAKDERGARDEPHPHACTSDQSGQSGQSGESSGEGEGGESSGHEDGSASDASSSTKSHAALMRIGLTSGGTGRRQRRVWGEVLYEMQSHPEYIARLVEAASGASAPAVSGARSQDVLVSLIFALYAEPPVDASPYALAASTREERLLLRSIQLLLEAEFERLEAQRKHERREREQVRRALAPALAVPASSDAAAVTEGAAAAPRTAIDAAPPPTARDIDERRRALMRTFLRSRSALASMLTRYGKRLRARKALIRAVLPVVREMLRRAEELGEDLVTEPLRVHASLRTHSAADDNAAAIAPQSNEEALQLDSVAAEVEKRYLRLRYYVEQMIERIARAAHTFPFGIRWICRQLQHMSDGKTSAQLHSQTRGGAVEYDTQTSQIVGAFFFLRFVNPCLMDAGNDAIWLNGDDTEGVGGDGVTAALAATTAVKLARSLASSIAADDQASTAARNPPTAAACDATAAGAKGGAAAGPSTSQRRSGEGDDDSESGKKIPSLARQNLLRVAKLLQHVSNGVTPDVLGRRTPWLLSALDSGELAERAAVAAKGSVAPVPSLSRMYVKLTSVPLRLAPVDEVELDVYLAHLSSRRDTDTVVLSLSDMRILHGLLWVNRDRLSNPRPGSDDQLLRRVLMQLGPPEKQAALNSSSGDAQHAANVAVGSSGSNMQERVTIRLLEANEELWEKAQLEMDVNATYSFERKRSRSRSGSTDFREVFPPLMLQAPSTKASALALQVSGASPLSGLSRNVSFEDLAVQTHLAVVTTPWKSKRHARSPSSDRASPAMLEGGGGESSVPASPPQLVRIPPRRLTRSSSLGLIPTFLRAPNIPEPSRETEDHLTLENVTALPIFEPNSKLGATMWQRWGAAAMPLLLMLPSSSLCAMIDALSKYGTFTLTGETVKSADNAPTLIEAIRIGQRSTDSETPAAAAAATATATANATATEGGIIDDLGDIARLWSRGYRRECFSESLELELRAELANFCAALPDAVTGSREAIGRLDAARWECEEHTGNMKRQLDDLQKKVQSLRQTLTPRAAESEVSRPASPASPEVILFKRFHIADAMPMDVVPPTRGASSFEDGGGGGSSESSWSTRQAAKMFRRFTLSARKGLKGGAEGDEGSSSSSLFARDARVETSDAGTSPLRSMRDRTSLLGGSLRDSRLSLGNALKGLKSSRLAPEGAASEAAPDATVVATAVATSSDALHWDGGSSSSAADNTGVVESVKKRIEEGRATRLSWSDRKQGARLVSELARSPGSASLPVARVLMPTARPLTPLQLMTSPSMDSLVVMSTDDLSDDILDDSVNLDDFLIADEVSSSTLKEAPQQQQQSTIVAGPIRFKHSRLVSLGVVAGQRLPESTRTTYDFSIDSLGFLVIDIIITLKDGRSLLERVRLPGDDPDPNPSSISSQAYAIAGESALQPPAPNAAMSTPPRGTEQQKRGGIAEPSPPSSAKSASRGMWRRQRGSGGSAAAAAAAAGGGGGGGGDGGSVAAADDALFSMELGVSAAESAMGEKPSGPLGRIRRLHWPLPSGRREAGVQPPLLNDTTAWEAWAEGGAALCEAPAKVRLVNYVGGAAMTTRQPIMWDALLELECVGENALLVPICTRHCGASLTAQREARAGAAKEVVAEMLSGAAGESESSNSLVGAPISRGRSNTATGHAQEMLDNGLISEAEYSQLVSGHGKWKEIVVAKPLLHSEREPVAAAAAAGASGTATNRDDLRFIWHGVTDAAARLLGRDGGKGSTAAECAAKGLLSNGLISDVAYKALVSSDGTWNETIVKKAAAAATNAPQRAHCVTFDVQLLVHMLSDSKLFR